MAFLLFSFGFSLNITNTDQEELAYITLDGKNFSQLYPDESPFGIVNELLINCKIPKFYYLERCRKDEFIYFEKRDMQYISFVIPVLFSALAFFTAFCIIQVNKLVVIPQNKEETIPVKMYCLKSFHLQEVEILPQYFDIQQTEIPKSWDSIVNDPIEDSLQIPQILIENQAYGQIGSNINIFDTADVKSSDITYKPLKSLFSSENWY